MKRYVSISSHVELRISSSREKYSVPPTGFLCFYFSEAEDNGTKRRAVASPVVLSSSSSSHLASFSPPVLFVPRDNICLTRHASSACTTTLHCHKPYITSSDDESDFMVQGVSLKKERDSVRQRQRDRERERKKKREFQRITRKKTN